MTLQRTYSFYSSYPGSTVGNFTYGSQGLGSNLIAQGSGATTPTNNQNFLNKYIKRPFLRGLDAFLGGEGFISGESTPSTEAFKKFLDSTETNAEGELIFKGNKSLIDGYADLFPAGTPNAGGIIKGIRDKAKNIITGGGEKTTTDPEDVFGMKQFQEQYNKQNQKYLNQAYLFGGLQNAANSIQKGAAYYPAMTQAMMNQTVGTLASLSQGQKALATALAAPVTPIRRMGYYG
tara:strand:+ start:3132 stop:3833 length:702 start_codon:yes stop_codon:yes gene_type:complete